MFRSGRRRRQRNHELSLSALLSHRAEKRSRWIEGSLKRYGCEAAGDSSSRPHFREFTVRFPAHFLPFNCPSMMPVNAKKLKRSSATQTHTSHLYDQDAHSTRDLRQITPRVLYVVNMQFSAVYLNRAIICFVFCSYDGTPDQAANLSTRKSPC